MMSRFSPLRAILGLVLAVICATSASSEESSGRIPDRITGYGGYTFGMSLSEAKKIDPTMRETKCDYRQASVSVCLEKDDRFFGEEATVQVLFSDTDMRVSRVDINFSRMKPADGVCRDTFQTVSKALFNRFGEPTKVEKGSAWWYAPGGGGVHLLVLCVTDEAGLVKVIYSPSPGF